MPFRMSYPAYSEAELAYAPTSEGVMVNPYYMATSMACQPSSMIYPSSAYTQDAMAAYTTTAADFSFVSAPVQHMQHSLSQESHLPPGQLPLPQFAQHQHHSHPPSHPHSRSHSGDYSTPMSHASPYDHSSVWVTPALSASPVPSHSVLASAPMSSPMPGHTPRSSKDFSLSPNLGLSSRSSRASSFTSVSGGAYQLNSDCSDRGLSISGISVVSSTAGVLPSTIAVVGSNGSSSIPRYSTPIHSRSHHSHPHSRSTSPSNNTTANLSLHAYGSLQKNGTWTCNFPGCTSKAVFTRGCDLRKHHKRHTKSFFCSHEGCPQASGGGFSSKKDLARHEAKHDPHVGCEWAGCGRVFSRVDNMRDHVKRIHLKAAKQTNQAARLSR